MNGRRASPRRYDAGVSGGDLVGLLLRRSPAVIASILGAVKAGAAYVPLDPEYPPYRLNLMVGSVGLTAMLAEAETADMARGLTGNQAVDLDQRAGDQQPERGARRLSCRG